MTTRKPAIGDKVFHKSLGLVSEIQYFTENNSRVFVEVPNGACGNYPINVLAWNSSTNQWEMT